MAEPEPGPDERIQKTKSSVKQLAVRVYESHYKALKALRDGDATLAGQGGDDSAKTVIGTLRGWECADDSGQITQRGLETIDAYEERHGLRRCTCDASEYESCRCGLRPTEWLAHARESPLVDPVSKGMSTKAGGSSTPTRPRTGSADAVAESLEPNELLQAARERIKSASGESMSRSELGTAVREWISEGTGCKSSFDGHYVARLERGGVRWPKLEYREALRGILQVATDLELGFYPPGCGDSTPNQNSLLEAVRGTWAKTRKINIHGQDVVLDDDHPLAESPTTRVGRARAQQTLPNGYCGLPIESGCEHANPCLTCPLFLTTPAFVSQHQARLRSSLKLIDQAEAAGHLRLAEKNRVIADNLTKIISACQPGRADDHAPKPENPSLGEGRRRK